MFFKDILIITTAVSAVIVAVPKFSSSCYFLRLLVSPLTVPSSSLFLATIMQLNRVQLHNKIETGAKRCYALKLLIIYLTNMQIMLKCKQEAGKKEKKLDLACAI